MTVDSVLYDLDSLYLDIDPQQQTQAWQQSQKLSTPQRRWQGYLNQLGLNTLLTWLKAEDFSAKAALAAPLQPTLWELITGSAIDCQEARLVLLPTEAIDDDELRVPQSWVDIPNWLGDYYLALQINPDEGWVRLAGFATHQDLKSKGTYDWRDRTYSLEAAELTTDSNVLWVAQNLYPEATKRATVTPLPNLEITQAHQLIERLSSPTVREPRLAISFEQWGPLVAHGGWRRQLAQRRWGQPVLSLRQWLRSGVSQLAEQLGWQQMVYQPAMATAREAGEMAAERPVICRELEIEGAAYILQVMPLTTAENAWRFELTKAVGLVSPGVTLRLLTEDLQPFENNQAIATEAVDGLYVDVAVANKEGLVWQTQPVPSQYDQEILRF